MTTLIVVTLIAVVVLAIAICFLIAFEDADTNRRYPARRAHRKAVSVWARLRSVEWGRLRLPVDFTVSWGQLSTFTVRAPRHASSVSLPAPQETPRQASVAHEDPAQAVGVLPQAQEDPGRLYPDWPTGALAKYVEAGERP